MRRMAATLTVCVLATFTLAGAGCQSNAMDSIQVYHGFTDPKKPQLTRTESAGPFTVVQLRAPAIPSVWNEHFLPGNCPRGLPSASTANRTARWWPSRGLTGSPWPKVLTSGAAGTAGKTPRMWAARF